MTRFTLMASLLTLLTTLSPVGHASPRGPMRVLLVFSPSDADPLLREQRAALRPGSVASAERDLSVIEIVGEQASDAQVDGRALRSSFRVPREVFTVVLIGKDGGEKLRQLRPLSEAALFAAIDRMPMRREEMARQRTLP